MENLLKPDIGTYIFVMVTLLWWSEFLIFKKKHTAEVKTNRNGRFSFFLILAAIVFPLILSTSLYLLEVGNLPDSAASLIRNTGIFIYTAGILLRYWSLIVLGKHFTREVEVEEGQDLVSTGPYRIIRHPSYTGLLLLILGLQFFIGNLPGIILSIICISAAIHVRILEEEQSMEEVMGKRYYNWKIKRKRLFPWFY